MYISMVKIGLLIVIFLSCNAFGQLAEHNSEGLAFGHVRLNVSDTQYHTSLWVNHFGGVVAKEGESTIIQLPNMMLLLTNDEQSIGSRSTVMDHIGFKVRDIETFLDKWRSAGFEVGREFIGAEGQKNAYITMSDGIYVELQEDQALPEAVTAYHLHFYTSEYRSLLNWYLSVFDLSMRPRGSISTTTNVPGMNLSFADSSTTRLATPGSAIDSIGFEVKNLDRTLQTLRDKQISITPPSKFFTSLGIKSAALTDPSGVTIILTEGLMNFPQASK